MSSQRINLAEFAGESIEHNGVEIGCSLSLPEYVPGNEIILI